MRALATIPFLLLVGSLAGCVTDDGTTSQATGNRAQCAGFGFEEGTDAFANCMMQLSLRQQSDQPPDHEARVRQYKNRSMARIGDDRYPVCGAAMMDAELDISTGKWVGPNCQMASD